MTFCCIGLNAEDFLEAYELEMTISAPTAYGRRLTAMAKIELSKSQITNLMNFFEFDFIQSIRDDEDVDNINYLVDMCDIYKKLKDANEKAGDGK